MPGMYHDKDYDLAGFAVGAAERGTLLPRNDIKPGDAIVAIASSGVHSNGFSLVRKIVEISGVDWYLPAPFDENRTLSGALLTPTRIYVKPILSALKAGIGIKALAHITGGGFIDNIPRVLPDNVSAHIDLNAVQVPKVFGWLARVGGMGEREMLRTFNCGVGMICVIDPGEGRAAGHPSLRAGREAALIGRITEAGAEPVTFEAARALKKRVAILISGRGSNMSALIEAARAPDFPAEIVGVFSNRPEAGGLAIAAAEGIATSALSHKSYTDKAAFEAAMNTVLDGWRPDIICLAGFMRLLSAEFCTRWAGQLINIHPSLLPRHKGLHTHEQALADGAAEHGCTVHFVTPGMDEGPIIAQARIPVLPATRPKASRPGCWSKSTGSIRAPSPWWRAAKPICELSAERHRFGRPDAEQRFHLRTPEPAAEDRVPYRICGSRRAAPHRPDRSRAGR